MHRLTVSLLFVVMNMTLYAQRFSALQELSLPDTISNFASEVMDIDNDGLQDILLIGQGKSQKFFISYIKGDTIDGYSLSTKSMAIPPYDSYVVYDFDNDNQIDILFSLSEVPQKTMLLLNQGEFVFQTSFPGLPPFKTAALGDLDTDGKPEFILSGESNGEYFTKTYFYETLSQWKLVHDSLKIGLSDLKIFDFDRDGLNDIFLSGHLKNDSIVSAILLRGDDAHTLHKTSESIGHSIVVDSDLNGTYEVFLYGRNKINKAIVQTFKTGEEAVHTELIDGKINSRFLADLNSDGKIDVNDFTVTSATDTINLVKITDGSPEILLHKNIFHQSWADLDQDGDLDVVQLMRSNSLGLRFLENKTAEVNKAPSKPALAMAIPVYDRTLLFWTIPADDHTTPNSLTYDVFLDGDDTQQPVMFDLVNGKRLRSSHGNNGSANFKLLKRKPANLNYAVQPIDNALFAGPGGICVGNGVSACGNISTEKISACTDEHLQLESPQNAYWFSFSAGFMANGTQYNLKTEKKDTVFYFIPSPTGCSGLKMFEIEINDDVQKTQSVTKYVCAGTEVILSADPEWSNFLWSSAAMGSLGNTAQVAYETMQDDKVTVQYSNDEGCKLQIEFDIHISKPAVTVSAENYQIMKGQSVQLSAGGGTNYTWSPSEGLNKTDIANPVASPHQDTQYTVTAYDSIGCSASDIIKIYVESSGFIPNLFTPNSDGQNDQLKVYGVSSVQNFKLKIFNREGSMVYNTENISEALQSGWDGKSKGVEQPNGVYYWKVEGTFGTGRKLLLNGKNEGAIVLLR